MGDGVNQREEWAESLGFIVGTLVIFCYEINGGKINVRFGYNN